MEKQLKTKICGLKFKANLEEVIKLEPDYVGFIFYTESPRYVGNLWEASMLNILPDTITAVAVTVDMPVKDAEKLAKWTDIKTFQLHGSENADYCSYLQDAGITVIKALPVSNRNLLEKQARQFAFSADYLLLDTPSATFGGTGQKFDWKLLNNLEIELPWFLSGGLDAESVKNMETTGFNEMFYGLDANSKLEVSPGNKSVELCQAFLYEARKIKI